MTKSLERPRLWTPRDYNGSRLQPIFFRRDGRPVFPVMGGAPTAATMQPAPQQARKRGSGDRPVMPTVPFIRASSENTEGALLDVSKTAAVNPTNLGVFDIPAHGYTRGIVLLIEVTGGTGTTLVFNEDAPFNWIRDIVFSEPNGAVIGQWTSGYGLAVASNKYGGYRHSLGGSDPRA